MKSDARWFAIAVLAACSKGRTIGDDAGSDGAAPPGCDGGTVACGGACVDTSSDPKNCGSCGNACTGGDRCCASACVATASCSFAVTRVEPAGGWQNGGDWLTLRGAGFAKGLRVDIGTGRAPVRVVDPGTARIQTPPGPLGRHDVKITLGATTATLRGGFEYRTAGLVPPWQQRTMAKVRGEHPALAVLQDGRVLVVGGTTKPDDAFTAQNTAEIFDRKTETVSFVANTTSASRWFDTAVTLLDGRVLVYGGACTVGNAMNCTGNLKAADLFDPATNAFSPTASPLGTERYWTLGALLPDGRVLVGSSNDRSLETFDPDTGTFTPVAGQLAEAHVLGFMVRLRDGRVLVGAGFTGAGSATAAIYDPDLGTLSPTGKLVKPRGWLTAHTLPDGRVAVIGGTEPVMGTYAPLATIELFDPQSGTFSTAPVVMQKTRFAHASALVRDGTILVLGGYVVPTACTPPADTNTVEQIDLVKNTVAMFASLPQPRVESSAVTLLDGSVLHVAGGHCGTQVATPYLDFLAGAPGPN